MTQTFDISAPINTMVSDVATTLSSGLSADLGTIGMLMGGFTLLFLVLRLARRAVHSR